MPLIDVKAAAKAAQDYLLSLFPETVKDVRLEEVEVIDGAVGQPAVWNVTLSYTTPGLDSPKGLDALEKMLNPTATPERRYPRYYKLFVIDAKTGEARAMKIRQV